LFAVLYIGHKLATKSKFVNPAEADLMTGQFKEEMTETWEEVSPMSTWKKIIGVVF
jgi:amino acid transporter